MDMLQVIKDEHNKLRELASRLSHVEAQKDRKTIFKDLEFHLSSHLRIEAEFVYPEAEDCLLPMPASFFELSLENHKNLRRALKNVARTLEKGALACKKTKIFDNLFQALNDHFELEESVLMPRMRKGVPTQEREDLGLVYLDMISEFPEVKRAPLAARARRRA